jgi:ribosomal protein S18 acetylase RimI-like enzyme
MLPIVSLVLRVLAMDVRSLAFRTDLALLALGTSEIEDRGTHIVVRTPDNPTFYWGNFMLLSEPPEPTEIDGWLAAYDAEFPHTQHRAFGVDGTEDRPEAMAPFVQAGLSLDIGAVMTAQAVHEPPRPNREAQYRTLESDDDWAQRVRLTASCNEDFPPEQYFTFASRKAAYERGLTQAGHGAWWGAFVAGEMVSGLGLFRAEAGLARFQSVETHPDARGRGLAGTLVHHASRHAFETLGADTLVMVADPDYLAIRIYRSVGFSETERQSQVQQVNRNEPPAR